jgi:hypothetical protein
MSRLPHKAPLIYARKALDTNENDADVEVDFGEPPTLAMHIEAAAQAFSFIDRQDGGTWGVVAMIKNSNLKSKCQDSKYICKVSITQSIHPYYKVSFQSLTKSGDVVADGELSIKIF